MTNAERELIAAALEHADDHHDNVIGGSRRLSAAAAAVRAEREPKPRYAFLGAAERELIAEAISLRNATRHVSNDNVEDEYIGVWEAFDEAADKVIAERAPKPRYHFFGSGLIKPQTYTVQDYKERKAVCFTNDAHAAELVVAALNAAEAAK